MTRGRDRHEVDIFDYPSELEVILPSGEVARARLSVGEGTNTGAYFGGPFDPWVVGLDGPEFSVRGQGSDAYEAFQEARRACEPVLVRCFGASLDVAAGGMAGDESSGLMAYRFGPEGDVDLQHIFAPDDDWIPCTVDEQREFTGLAASKEVPDSWWTSLRSAGALPPAPPLVIYKCNNASPDGFYGDWYDCFARAAANASGTEWWGGAEVTNQAAARNVAAGAAPGQQVLCWQRWGAKPNYALPPGCRAGVAGIAEIVAVDPSRAAGDTWELALVEEFWPPVELLSHRKTNPVIDAIFRNPRQIGTFTQLTPEEDREVRRLCRESEGYGDLWDIGAGGAGAGYGDATHNAEVEQAAVDRVRRAIEGDGWLVQSVEMQRIGYDLHATKDGDERHVEVKGVSGPLPSFFLTANEVRQARTDQVWEIWVVTRATTTPTDHRFSGAELELIYDLEPVSFRASPV